MTQMTDGLKANVEATHVTSMYFVDQNSVNDPTKFSGPQRKGDSGSSEGRMCYGQPCQLHKPIFRAWWVWFSLVLTVGQVLKGTLFRGLTVMDIYP